MSMRDFDEYVQALMGACEGYAEQAAHAKDDVERNELRKWLDGDPDGE